VIADHHIVPPLVVGSIKDRAAIGEPVFCARNPLDLLLGMISAQTLRVCREGKPLHTFPDHA
jgi:hypothetical protein